MNVYEIVQERIVKMLQDGVVPWRKPWKDGLPSNAISGKSYRGINTWMLTGLPYSDPRFLTFKQAVEKGGMVRKGEKGHQVVFWKMLSKEEEGAKSKNIPLLRYFTVFNVEQCEGLNIPTLEQKEFVPIEVAEHIVAEYADGPIIGHSNDPAAFYSPRMDSVHMPNKELFESEGAYYGSLFHELTHSTGHSRRLDRGLSDNLAPFGSPDYSREELIAEMGASFLMAECGMMDSLAPSASYINGWLGVLENDVKAVVSASGKAQKAVEYILGKERKETVDE